MPNLQLQRGMVQFFSGANNPLRDLELELPIPLLSSARGPMGPSGQHFFIHIRIQGDKVGVRAVHLRWI